MSRAPDGQVDWEMVRRRVGAVLDWSFIGIRGIVMAALTVVRIMTQAAGRAIRWFRANRDRVVAVLRRLVRPVLFLTGFAAGAAGGAVVERAALRRPRAAPFVPDPTPYGSPALIDGPDGRIFVHRHGKPGLPVVVLVHGWSNSHVVWHKQVSALHDRFHVVTYDQPGHGTSDAPAVWSMDVFGRALRAVIESTGADSVTVAGHSLGGAAILALAQVEPGFFAQHVNGTVFVGSAASFSDRDASASLLQRLERRLHIGGRLIRLRAVPLVALLSRRSSDLSHIAFRLVAFGHRPDPADVDLTEQLWTDADPAMITSLAAALDRWNGRAGCQRLPRNTAVLGGSRDLVLPPALSREIADLAGIDDLAILPGRGHQLHLEAPVEVSEAIERVATKGAADGAGS